MKPSTSARLWWIAAHVFGYSVLLYNGILAQAFTNVSTAYSYLICIVANTAAYVALQRSSPGFITRECDEVNEKENNTENEKLADSEIQLRECEQCSIRQPLRAKHCTNCKHCVRFYDHCCACAGTCIGENNRRLFIVYLKLQVIEAWWNSLIVWHAFVDATEHRRRSGLWWMLLLVYMSLLATLLLNVPLLCFQWYLVCSNQSSWEFARRDKITYLKHLPLELNPFDHGAWNNVVDFWLHRTHRLHAFNLTYKLSENAEADQVL